MYRSSPLLRVLPKLGRSVPIRHFRASTNDPSALTLNDVGKMYEVPMVTADVLGFPKHLPSAYRKQLDTFNECVWMCRKPFLEVVNCLQAVRQTHPSMRVVLWGKFGTGKSITLHQAIHYANSQNWVVFTIDSAMNLTRKADEIQMSSYKNGRIDCPTLAVGLLNLFKQQNRDQWKKLSELLTSKTYEWTKVDRTLEGKPITDIVEMGLSAPFMASDCVGALIRELKRHSSSGVVKLLVAIDNANSLYGKTLVKRADRTYAPPDDLTLVHQVRKFFLNDWSNGATVMVADKKEISDARDMLTTPLNTPLELFGEKGFDAIDPFIAIETGLYTKEEANAVYDYYMDKKWIASPKARTEEARQQLLYLSAFNPFHYERLCAFN
uniref:Small ribosomal subunit protein mS29 n=1 Tax=Steinernema glaseri TaxID=37863 RepID=A0A1I8AQD9_9BILA